MHILIGIISVIAAASYYFFIFKRGAEAANEVIDVALDLRSKIRRSMFKKKVDGSALAAVEDPGTAAAIMLMKIADCDNYVSDEEKALITSIVRDEMEMSDADEVVPFAEWVSKQVVDGKSIIRAYKSMWMEQLSKEQISQLIDMAQRVADLDKPANGEQKEIIRLMRERLLS